MTNFERSSLISQHFKSLKLVNELRAGDSRLTQAAWLLITIWMLQQQSAGFQPINPVPRPPHLQGLYGNQHPGNPFGYRKGAGPRIIKVVGATQNAGSDKKKPSSGSWEYIDVMRKLDKQSNKKIITIQVADQTYNIKNPYRQSADELQFVLAEKVYDSSRESDTDICDIA
jgi:hypothetical protein